MNRLTPSRRTAAALALLCLLPGAWAGAVPDADTSWDADGLTAASIAVPAALRPPDESFPLADAVPDVLPKRSSPVCPRALRAPPLRDVS